MPYIKAVEFLIYQAATSLPFEKIRVILERPFPYKAIQRMKEFLAHAPNSNTTIWQQSLRGAVSEIVPNHTAYYYRNALIAQEYNTSWENSNEEEQNMKWVENLRRALSPYTSGDYVNFPDRFIQDWQTAYYGRNFRRLREVKTKYDPYNVFQFPQSIPPIRKWL